MNKVELGSQTPETIQLLKPVEDFSTFIQPGYANLLLTGWKEAGIIIYENEQLMVTKDQREVEGLSTMWYHVFDKTNGLPHYALNSLMEDKSIIGARTYDYYSSYDRDLMEIPMLTSTCTSVVPMIKTKEIYKSELDLTDPDLYRGISEKVYSHEVLLFDNSCKELASKVTKQISFIPGEEHIKPYTI